MSDSHDSHLNRKSFLQRVGTGAAAAAAIGATGLPAFAQEADKTEALRESASKAANRCKKSYQYRVACAKNARDRALIQHTNNGDEALYANKIGSYSKGLPHNAKGEVDLAAYATLVHAVDTEDPADWERITLGL